MYPCQRDEGGCMKSETLSNWLQIAANIGILIGLILVGFQINQASNLQRLQLLYEDEGRAIENESTLLGDNPIEVLQKAMQTPEDLSFGEMRLLEAYHYRPYAQLERRYKAKELLGESWKDDVQDVAWVYGTPFGRAWWDEVKSTAPKEIRELVDDSLGNQSITFQQDHFNRVIKNTKKYQDIGK